MFPFDDLSVPFGLPQKLPGRSRPGLVFLGFESQKLSMHLKKDEISGIFFYGSLWAIDYHLDTS